MTMTTHKAQPALLGMVTIRGIDHPVPNYAKTCSVCGRRVRRLTKGPAPFAHSGGVEPGTKRPTTRAKLVRLWKRFSLAYEEHYAGQDDAVDGMSVSDVLSTTPGFVRLTLTRAAYLKGLVEAGLISGYEGCPDDDRLWEIHPNNLSTPEGLADLWEA